MYINKINQINPFFLSFFNSIQNLFASPFGIIKKEVFSKVNGVTDPDAAVTECPGSLRKKTLGRWNVC
jgi:hypothetical protein